jgi:biopolymer transport protein ExbB/TolQ
MVEELMHLIDYGVEWVLWLLLVLGAGCLGVFLDRLYVLTKYGGDTVRIKKKLVSFLEKDDWDGAMKYFKNGRTVQERILAEALNGRPLAPEALGELIESRQLEERQFLSRGIGYLGTLGSNAPFVGLFGTVLGIIRAFRDLSVAAVSGPAVVMKGISEALVATAIGLLVAIPALVMHNYFVGRIGKVMRGSSILAKIVLSLHLDRTLSRGPQGSKRDADVFARGVSGSVEESSSKQSARA